MDRVPPNYNLYGVMTPNRTTLWQQVLAGDSASSGARRFRLALWIGVLLLAGVRFVVPIYAGVTPVGRPENVPRNSWWASVYPNAIVAKGEAGRVGYSLYRHHSFADPYISLPTGPTAHLAPLFPTMLAGLYLTFGDGPRGQRSIQIAEALALTAEVMLLPLVARALGADIMIGFIAAILSIFGLRREWFWENNYVGLLLVLATLLAANYIRSVDSRVSSISPPPLSATVASGRGQRGSPLLWAVASGALWGIILLTGPSAALVWLGWILAGALYSYRRGIQFAWLPALLLPVFMIVPWASRNYRVLHSPVPLRSNLGLELMVGNNACAQVSMAQSFPCFWRFHPNTNPEEARKVIQLGEVNYNRLKLRQAEDWIRSNPRSFLRLTSERVLFFWFPTETGKLADVWRERWAWVVYPATLLSVPGLLILWRVSRPGALLLLTLLVLYPPIYYLVLSEYRYRFPIMWVTSVLAAAAIWRVLPQRLRASGCV